MDDASTVLAAHDDSGDMIPTIGLCASIIKYGGLQKEDSVWATGVIKEPARHHCPGYEKGGDCFRGLLITFFSCRYA